MIGGTPHPIPTPRAILSLVDSPDVVGESDALPLPLGATVEAEGAVLLVGVATAPEALPALCVPAEGAGVAVAVATVEELPALCVPAEGAGVAVAVATVPEELPALGVAVAAALATEPTKIVDVAVTSPTEIVPASFSWLHVSKIAAMSPLNRAAHVFVTLYQSIILS